MTEDGDTGSHAPSRAPAPTSGWRGTLAAAAVVLAVLMVATAARVVWFDAYWLFRETPPWLAVTGGGNRLLDRQTRRGKILQGLDRDYTVALLGSSTVYHGLDPRDVAPRYEGQVYNLGISALMGREIPTVAAVVASRPAVRRAVLALDYYMFSRDGGPPPLSTALRGPVGRANAQLGSLLSLYAIEDARMDAVAGSADPGAWTRDGFRITPPLPPLLTRENAAIRRRTTAAYRPDTMAALDDAIGRLAGLDLTVYLSPVSDAQRGILADLGFADDFARWRADAARIAAARGVRFLDLVDLGTHFPFDPDKGSTAVWIDNLHYTPVLGREVLRAVGLR